MFSAAQVAVGLTGSDPYITQEARQYRRQKSVTYITPVCSDFLFLYSGQIPAHLIVETYTWPATNCAASISSSGMTW